MPGGLNATCCFIDKRHPREMDKLEIADVLSRLATERGVAAGSQNQALAALLFLYKDVLAHKELPWLDNLTWAKRPARLPVVPTRQECQRLLVATAGDGAASLVVRLLYGTGMRLLRALPLARTEARQGSLGISRSPERSRRRSNSR